jgi:hypothetical protein
MALLQGVKWEDEQRLEMQNSFSAFFNKQPFPPGTAQSISHLYIQECAYIWKPMVAIPVSTLQADHL